MRPLWLALLLALCPAPTPASAGDAPAQDPAGDAAAEACIEAGVEVIQRRYGDMRDLRARFEQTLYSNTLGGAGGLTASRGHVVLAKPGKMRWSYEQPEPSLVVSDGATLWIYDPARAEVQQMPVAEGYLSGAALQFLLGEGDIRREFRVTLLSCSQESVELELEPRRPASYEKLRIRADRATGDLRETGITDLLGNVTEIAFSEIQANQDPEPGTFRFDPPSGVRVIEVGPPAGEAAGR